MRWSSDRLSKRETKKRNPTPEEVERRDLILQLTTAPLKKERKSLVAKKVPVLWSTGGIADALGIRYETIDRVAQEIKLPSLVVVRNKGSECFAMSQADANKLRRELVKRYRSGKRGYAGREEIGERLAKVKVGA